MNNRPSQPFIPPAGLPIYRPEDGVLNLIALASERMEFYSQQVGLLDQALSILVHEHGQIIEWYRSQIEAERSSIERLRSFVTGNSMQHPEQGQQDQQTGQNQSAASTVFNGEMTVSPDELALIMERRRAQSLQAGEQKNELLRALNSPEDNKPRPELGDRSRRQMVEQAIPMPQNAVAVAEYAAGEELPPEAKPGHLSVDPRPAQELIAEANRRAAEKEKSETKDGEFS